MTTLLDKRTIVQPILDGIELGWTIVKPSRFNPTDVEEECIFQKGGSKEARVQIPNPYFQDADQRHKIKPLVEDAIRNAKVK